MDDAVLSGPTAFPSPSDTPNAQSVGTACRAYAMARARMAPDEAHDDGDYYPPHHVPAARASDASAPSTTFRSTNGVDFNVGRTRQRAAESLSATSVGSEGTHAYHMHAAESPTSNGESGAHGGEPAHAPPPAEPSASDPTVDPKADGAAAPTPPPSKGPLAHRWCPYPIFLFCLFMLAAGYYIYVRLNTLTSTYALFILVCELLGLSSFIPYALLLTRGIFPTNSPGLPPCEEGAVADEGDIRFSVHVLIPCYREPLEVLQATVTAALEAQLPAHAKRTVYLLDDGGSADKRAYIQSFCSDEVRYITGRERKPGQVNGKSENLNNALRNHIFNNHPKCADGSIDWQQLSATELIVVFDADMRAKPDFFLKTLEVMTNEEYQLVLTPQAFHNIHPDADLFNNVNKQFWEYWLPGAFAWGYIACTGTNFVLRARALASCGWFPNKTITEDYALGMELKKRGYKAAYLMQYLAEGEAPEDVRNIFQQRSRWTKGHWQVFFSKGNSLFIPGLPFFQRLWYCYAAWAPFCNTITTPVFILVPFMSIFFGYHPVSISFEYVLAATVYFLCTMAIQYYVRSLADIKFMWYANISNTVLFFTQLKAFVNSTAAAMGAKSIVFKVTAKNKAADGAIVHPVNENMQHSSQKFFLVPVPYKEQQTPPRKQQRQGSSRSTHPQQQQQQQQQGRQGCDTPNHHANQPNHRRQPSGGGDVEDPLLWRHAPRARSGSAASSVHHPAGAPGIPEAAAPQPGTPASPAPSSLYDSPKHGLHPPALLGRFMAGGQAKDNNQASYMGNNGHGGARANGAGAAHDKDSDSEEPSFGTPRSPLSRIRTKAGGGGGRRGGDERLGLLAEHHETSNTPSYTSDHLKRRANKGGSAAVGETPKMLTAVGTPKVAGTPHYMAVSIVPTPKAPLIGGSHSPSTPVAAKSQRGARLRALLQLFEPKNLSDFGAMLDPVVLICILLLSLATAAVGIWEMTSPAHGSSRFLLNSPISGSPFLIIATSWAMYNCVAPYLFCHYCMTTGSSFRSAAKWLNLLSSVIMLGALAFLWLVIPGTVSPTDALDLSVTYLYPSSMAADTNTNFSFVTGHARVPIQVAQPSNLTGGLLTSDNAKYAVPLSYTLTMLSWAMLKFPRAFAGRDGPLLATLREGAEYLIRCDLNPGSVDNPMFAAQVGDGADYVVVPDAGYDPIAEGKVWTSPWEDPQLVGNVPRTVWVLTKDSVGADLLSDVAAALAAVGAVFNARNDSFGAVAVAKAVQMYSFATSQDANPQSYCAFVPCTTNVTVTQELVTKKVLSSELASVNNTLLLKASCYYVDWITRSCLVGTTVDACLAIEANNKNTYGTQIDCCNVLYDLDPSKQTVQGICVVPQGQWYCYIPDASARTCRHDTIDPLTGLGCSGKGLQIYTNALSCCESLSLTPDTGDAGTGVCSRAALDSTFTTCWVPDMSQGTCVNTTSCSGYGVETSYDSSIGCCNRLIALMEGNTNLLVGPTSGGPSSKTPLLTGVCARASPPAPLAPPPSPSPMPPPDNATLSLPTGAAGARLLQATSSPVKDSFNGTVWQVPDFIDCADGTCIVQEVSKLMEVTLYNSTSVLDDLAWGGAWLYMATGDSTYVGMAERYLARHYTEELNPAVPPTRGQYVADWDNTAWAANLLMYDLTGAQEYVDRITVFLKAWVTGDAVDTSGALASTQQHPPLSTLDSLLPSNFTDAEGNLYLIVPDCTPTNTFEDVCDDGIDNDCNGLIDRQDAPCGVFPVLYTENNLAFSSAPSLPNAATTAFLAMLYSELVPTAKQVQCWSLGQATYMLGGAQNVRSGVVGYGPDPPTVLQHRASSCVPGSGTTSAPCSWDSGFFPSLPNPNLDVVRGALIWGPSDGSDYPQQQRSSNDTRVRLEDNVGFTGLMAGLIHLGVNVDACFVGHGVVQKYIWVSDPVTS